MLNDADCGFEGGPGGRQSKSTEQKRNDGQEDGIRCQLVPRPLHELRPHPSYALHQITTMGELTASLAHEVNQPIAAAVTDADTCLRWLSRDQPDLDEAREAASRMRKDATRAADIIRRIRLLLKKGSPQREFVDINEVVREMVVLLRSEATPYSVSIQT